MMWYWGEVNNECHIGLATSEDGKTWSRSQDEPVLRSEGPPSWEFSCIGGQTVLFNPVREQLEMWYTGVDLDGPLGTFQLGYATSQNGIEWQKSPANPVLSPGGVDGRGPRRT